MASVSLILISSIFSGMSFSRYEVEQGATVSNSNLGSMEFNVTNIPNNNNNIVLPLTEVKPGMSAQTYTFSITNFNGSKYSKLPFEYQINIKTYGNLPINVQVKSKSLPSNTGVAASTVSASGTPTNPINLTTTGKMYVNTTTDTGYTHEYDVIITWPVENGINEDYSTEVEYLSISVVCSQLGPTY